MPPTATKPELKLIETSKIVPNKDNPRGPNVRENDRHRETLKESIAEFGILVPLVVRKVEEDKFELIDGERRYWVAQSLKLDRVPAYVFDGDLNRKAILQRMFQIHMNREPWDAVQQCKASESLFIELMEMHSGDVDYVIDEFAKLTGTDQRTARNRIQFLSWPKDVKESIYADPAKHDRYWYIVEIEDKIVDPAKRNYPEYFEKVKIDDVRRFLYKKWDQGVIRAAVDVRDAAPLLRKRLEKSGDRKVVIRILNRLVSDLGYSYSEAFDEFAQEFPALREPKLPRPRALLNSMRKLTGVLSEYELRHFEGYSGRTKPRMTEVIGAARELLDVAKEFIQRMKG